MLQLITGTTGSGKTTLLRQRVCRAVEGGARAIVVVPEQQSFETEKALYEMLGAEKAARAEVLSFTRLYNRIFRQYGGLAGEYIDDSARLLLMSVALGELRDKLSLYSGRVNQLNFVETLVSQVSEFKNAGVSPEELEAFAAKAQGEGLAEKTAELAEIYRHYQLLIECGYKDAEDDAANACSYLESDPFFADYDVYIDSFKSFTMGEYRMLNHMLAQSPAVTVALCAPSAEDLDGGLGLFSLVQKTAARLKRIAKENGVEAALPERLLQNRRAQSGELVHLEQNIFRAAPAPYPARCENIRLVKAQNQYEEVEYVAAAIGEAVRRGVRYRDMAVIGRDLPGYRQAFESVFERCDIPYFMDEREDVTGRPLIAAILHATEAVRRNFNTDEILALLKTALPGVSPERIGELENYCFVWEINGAAWLQEFTGSPAGYAAETGADKLLLERLNALRAEITAPLRTFYDAVQHCDGAGFARAVFAYLTDAGILERLRTAEEDDPIAGDCAQLYDVLVGLLEQFATALRGVILPPAQLAELLRMVAASVDIGSIPQTLDQVIVGSADRVRLSSPKAVFLVGANEGVFPAVCRTGGVFSDDEREQMIEAGLELAATAESKALDETFCAYTALCAPREQLTICWCAATLKGEALYPSAIVRGVRSVLPLAEVLHAGEQDGLTLIQNDKTAFDVFCAGLRQDNPFTASLGEYLKRRGQGARVERLLRPVKASEYRLSEPAVLRRLYGGDMAVSPSKLDQFYQCKLAYFCRYGLGVQPRRRAELSPMESGTVVHFVLQALLLRHSDLAAATADEAALRGEIRELLRQYIETAMGGSQGKTARFKYLFTRLENTLVQLLLHLAREFAESEFRPVYFELPIKKPRAEDVPAAQQGELQRVQALRVDPLELEADGGRVFVEGVVDRVDLMKRGGHYLRIVDYKTGAKRFDLTDVYNGLNLQMLIYLFTLREHGQGELAGATPAGILYLPARTQFSAMERGAGAEEAAAEQDKGMKMNGLLLESTEAITGMERGAEGVYIPVTIKTKEKTTGRGENKTTEVITEMKGDVATLAEFGKLGNYVKKLVVRMAESLRAGAAEAFPTYTKEYGKTCEYCAYRAVCGREEDGVKNEAERLDKETFFAKLEEEEAEECQK